MTTWYGETPAGSHPPQDPSASSGQPGPPPGQPHPPAGQPYPPPGLPHQAPPAQPYPPAGQPYPPPSPYQPSGAPPPPPPRSKRGLFLLLGILGVVVLLVLCVGTVVVLVSRFGGDDDGSGDGRNADGAGGALELAWTFDFPEPRAGDPNHAYQLAGSWLLDQTLVRAQHDRVTAYRLSDGTEEWAVPVPDGTTMCTTSPEPDNGVVAIVYGPPDRCDQMAGINLADGQQAWEVTIPAYPIDLEDTLGGLRDLVLDPRYVPHQVITAGGTALVYAEATITGQEIAAYSITDGAQQWRLESPEGCVFEGVNADAQTVVVGETCFGQHTVIGLDLATGDELWRTSLTDQQKADRVLSVSPTIIVMDDPGRTGEISVLDDAGAIVQTIPRAVDGIGFREGVRDIYDFPYLIHQDILYVGLDVEIDAPAGQIVAFDLRTGQAIWKSSGHTWRPTLIRVEDDGLLALEGNPYDESVRLVRVDLATGETSAVTQGPTDVIDPFIDYLVHERNGVVAIMTATWTSLESTTAVRLLLPAT